jgi:hypothetical protein
MKKLAFILPSLKKSGPGNVVLELVKGLKNQFEITIFYFDEKKDKIDFNFVKTEKISFFDYNKIRNYDIVHSHGIRPDIFNALFIRQALKTSTVHNYIKEDIGFLYNSKYIGFLVELFWVFFLKKMNKVVCLTYHMKSYYSKYINQIEVIHNARTIEEIVSNIKVDEEFAILEFKKDYFTLGMVCSVIKRKGIDTAFEVLIKNPNFKLIIIGDGQNKEEYMKLAIEYKITDRVLWLGFKNDSMNYIHYFDFYLLVSKSEGYPLSVIEAGLFKIPIISIKNNLYVEIFKDSVYFLNTDNIINIELLMSKKNIYKNSFYNSIKKEKSFSKMIEKYKSIYV